MADRGASRISVLPALLGLLLVVAGLVPAAAQTAQTASAPALTLRSQTTWWSAEQPFSLVLGINAPRPEGLEVAVSVYSLLRTRIAFAATVDGRTTGRAVESTVVPVTDLPVDERGDRALTFTPTVRADGVYPVRVELRPAGGGTAVDQFVTHLVRVPATLEGDRLAVATVVPVHATPSTHADGSVAIDDRRAVELAALAEGLEAQAEVPLTLDPTPETIEALDLSARAEDGTTLTSLVRSLRGRQLLGSSYVPTNLTSMVAAGLEEEVAGGLTRGTEVLRTRFNVEPTTSTRVVDERLSDDALAQLQAAQRVVRVVVPEAYLEPIASNKTLTSTFGMTSRRGPVAAAAADTALAAHFREASPVLAAQHLLADLAQIYNDDPRVLRRGVVVSPSRSWTPTAPFLDAYLGGLAASPLLAPVGVDAFFDAVDPGVAGTGSRRTPLVRRIAPPPAGAPAAPTLPGTDIRSARRDIDAFASALDPADPVGRGVIDRIDRTLLVAPSSDLRARDRTAYVQGVVDQLHAQLDGIAMPEDRSITLTAREGDIPVTITSRLGYPVRVVLQVSGRPVEFPDGIRQELELRRENTTSRFAVRAPSSGSFPIRIRLTTPTGDLTVASSRFTVRSTAISGVGTALSIGAALFLVVWWGNHLRGRRSKRLVPAA